MTTEEQTTKPPTGDNNAPNSPSTKVFVGNLSFRTRSPTLREAFEKAGRVEGAKVVTQGRRSMGYGFVQFASLEEAKKAVELLHRSSLDSREINVEVSTSLNTSLDPTVKRRRPRNKKPRNSSDKPEDAQNSPSGDASLAAPKEVDPATGEPKPAQKKPRKRRASKKKPAADANKSAKSPDDQEKSAASPAQNSDGKARRKKSASVTGAKPARKTAPRESAAPREISERVLYVSNIPFSLDDEGLKSVFAEFEPVSANVIRRKRNNLSKGFGFVEFGSAEKQQAALDAKNKAKIEDREISVKKAHIRPEPEADSAAANSNSTGSDQQTPAGSASDAKAE